MLIEVKQVNVDRRIAGKCWKKKNRMIVDWSIGVADKKALIGWKQIEGCFKLIKNDQTVVAPMKMMQV